MRPPRLSSVKSRSQSVAAIVAIDDELWSRRPCDMKPGGWRQLHPAGPHSLENTSALPFPYVADEIMCVIQVHTLATIATKTMNLDERITGNCLVFNPLNGETDAARILQICTSIQDLSPSKLISQSYLHSRRLYIKIKKRSIRYY